MGPPASSPAVRTSSASSSAGCMTPPSMPRPPALATATASSRRALPMPACWSGTAQPTSAVKRVWSISEPPDSSSAIHPAELATGDVDHLAVDVVAERRGEEQHRPCRLLRLCGPTDRDHHRGHRAHLLGDADRHFGPALTGLDGLALLLRLG